jgi:hypothetical protein
LKRRWLTSFDTQVGNARIVNLDVIEKLQRKKHKNAEFQRTIEHNSEVSQYTTAIG